MSDAALWLYHRLPAPARSAAASLRGYYLRRWRYGPETDRLIAEALERDHWTAAQWDRAREERLVYVLQRAATRVPYYRALWQARHRNAPAFGIAVNLSARQFMLGRLETTVTEALAASGLDPSTLSLEITESVLLEDPRAVGTTIASLAGLGVRFVLDDFGTGYSSLAYLSELPIHGLKVDRSFVAALGLDERSTAITTAVVMMAQALSVEVTAEGVQSEGQSNLLRALGCTLAQGFLFHRPLRADEVSVLLDQAAGPARRRPVAAQAA